MDITTKNMRALLIDVLLGIAVIIAVFAAIGGGWYLVKSTGLLPFKKAKRVLVIEETPITIEHVKAIGELVTATYYDEAVSIVRKSKTYQNGAWETTIERVTEEEADQNNTFNFKNLGFLVLVQKLHARIGVDFAELADTDLLIDEAAKSVHVTLPALKCLDAIMNPSDTEVFEESGKEWDFEDFKEALTPAKEEMDARMSADQALFDRARAGAQEVVTQLFRAAGYENVTVEFKSLENPKIELPPVQ